MKYPLFKHSGKPKAFSSMYKCDVYWFRIFGYGLHFKLVHEGYEPLFSERNGHTKVLKIGKLRIKALKPEIY